MPELKVVLSDSFNPHLNLATEEWIFHNMEPTAQVLFLWRNEPTVVIGRSQNPWSECNLPKMKEENVHLARRATGGGAVFHDLGNTNFTFLSPKDGYKRDNNVQIILRALAKLGIEGEASGRNDLLLKAEDGLRKFSGSAYREKRDRAFHHGTLLLHADLTRLANFLTPNPKKLQAKGKESVRMRVANLTEINPSIAHENIVSTIVATFEEFYGGVATTEHLTLQSLNSNSELKKQYEVLSSWDWLFGHTMEFNQQIDDYLSLGFFDFRFQVNDGRITDAQVFSDCLYVDLINEIRVALIGQKFESATARALGETLLQNHPHLAEGIKELSAWLGHHMEI